MYDAFEGVLDMSGEFSSVSSVTLPGVSPVMDGIALADLERKAEAQQLLWTSSATGLRRLLIWRNNGHSRR